MTAPFEGLPGTSPLSTRLAPSAPAEDAGWSPPVG